MIFFFSIDSWLVVLIDIDICVNIRVERHCRCFTDRVEMNDFAKVVPRRLFGDVPTDVHGSYRNFITGGIILITLLLY